MADYYSDAGALEMARQVLARHGHGLSAACTPACRQLLDPTEPGPIEERAYAQGLAQGLGEAIAVLGAPDPEASIRRIAADYGVDLSPPLFPGWAQRRLHDRRELTYQVVDLAPLSDRTFTLVAAANDADVGTCEGCGMRIFRTNMDGKWHHAHGDQGHEPTPKPVEP